MITLFLIIVLFFGVRVSITANYERMTVSIVIKIFGGIRVLELVMRVVNGKWFVSTTNGHPKRIYMHKKKYSLETFNMPRIHLYDVGLALHLSSGEAITNSMAGALFEMFVAQLEHGRRIIVHGIHHYLDITYDDFDIKAHIEFKIRYSIIAIILEYLHTILRDRKRRKYAAKSDRRTHGMHA